MASLTGLAFQVDFLLGRGSRQNTVNGIRDTVDQINLTARQGASKASKERRAKLKEDLDALQELSEKSAQRVAKGREAAGRSAATAAGKAAGAMTRKAKADTSGLDEIAKKTKSVAKEMKSSFSSLNAELKARGSTQLAGKSFTSQKTAVDFAMKEKAEREEIIAILQKEVDLARLSGTLNDGMILNLQIAKDLNKDVNALHDQDLATQKELAATAGKYWKEFKEGEADEEAHLRQTIALRQMAGQQIDNMAQSVGQTLRNSFVYSTAAVAAFYYKLNEVLTTFAAFEQELMNAQSIFQTTQDTLYGLSDQIVNFGMKYGIELQNATTGLYQLASAGLSASDSMAVLNDTLTLSMAVQGDHNTVSKLTTQTIFGFGLEMSDSTELVDKFAWAINKSLIEYQDLASAVKFAMPFFVSTGQSVDQLLGSLQVLTNRALEAGIAGRGLRQALAEFAESADDNTRAFRKMGIEITNSDGEFKQLTEIARDFHDTFGETANDVELMTTLLEDLNVRGATAFVHLVQNVDEFEGAVNDLQNSAGSAAEMAEIQNQSLNNQIQILKTALTAPFLIADEIGQAHGYINEFHMTLHQMVDTFSNMIYTTLPDGTQVLTELGEGMRDFVIEAFKQLTVLIYNGAQIFKTYSGNIKATIGLFNMILVPLKVMLAILHKLGPSGMQFLMTFKILNGLLPISTMRLNMETIAELQNMAATNASTGAKWAKIGAIMAEVGARAILYGAQGLMVFAVMAEAKGNQAAATTYAMLAGAVFMAATAYQALRAAQMGGPVAYAAAAAAGAIAGYAYIRLMRSMMSEMEGSVPPVEDFQLGGSAAEGTAFSLGGPTADTGMTIPRTYDTGGAPTSNHRTVYVEPGETITSKSMNMLGGVGGGITINIEGDVFDGDNFAEKVAESLPDAIREGMQRGYIVR